MASDRNLAKIAIRALVETSFHFDLDPLETREVYLRTVRNLSLTPDDYEAFLVVFNEAGEEEIAELEGRAVPAVSNTPASNS